MSLASFTCWIRTRSSAKGHLLAGKMDKRTREKRYWITSFPFSALVPSSFPVDGKRPRKEHSREATRVRVIRGPFHGDQDGPSSDLEPVASSARSQTPVLRWHAS